MLYFLEGFLKCVIQYMNIGGGKGWKKRKEIGYQIRMDDHETKRNNIEKNYTDSQNSKMQYWISFPNSNQRKIKN